MRNLSSVALCALGILAIGGPAPAQEAPQGPAKILQIYREEIKSGRSAGHEQVEAGYAKAYKTAGRTPYVAMATIAGPNEAWFIERYDSFAALEAESDAAEKDGTLQQALARLGEADSAFRTGGRTIIAEYREGLSYQPYANIAGMRYVDAVIIRVRPGQGRAFNEARELVKKAHEKAGVKESWVVYEVATGMPSGTYLMFILRKSLAELDSDPHSQAYRDALGDEGRAKLQKLTSEAVLSTDEMTFKFSPRMSNPAPWLVKADPFWAPKVTMAKPAAGAKPPTP